MRLLTVNGGFIELESNRQYVLGRALDADVVVPDMSCSRHHAQLTLGALAESCFLVDLDSRNGTYVNEERVTGRALGCQNQFPTRPTASLPSRARRLQPNRRADRLRDHGRERRLPHGLMQ